MSNYILSCCSTADLSEEHFRKRDIHYICFHYFLDGKAYDDDLGKSLSFDDFYKAMAQGAETKTSQINADEFIEYFTPFLEAGLDILHITLSTGISGVYNSAVIAGRELSEKYPERKIYIVDSLGASSGYGLLMDRLADLRDDGMDIDTLYQWAQDHRLELHHWFFSTDLPFYDKGGRKMEAHAKGGLGYNGKCFISNSACIEDAKAVAELVEKHFPLLDGPVQIYSVGTTIGSHTGPGTVALFFWGDQRMD